MRLINYKYEHLIGNLTLKSIMPLEEGHHWIGHTDNYIVSFKYKNNFLLLSMSETEYELEDNEQKIAAQTDILFFGIDMPITIKEILDFLEWECDDYFS